MKYKMALTFILFLAVVLVGFIYHKMNTLVGPEAIKQAFKSMMINHQSNLNFKFKKYHTSVGTSTRLRFEDVIVTVNDQKLASFNKIDVFIPLGSFFGFHQKSISVNMKGIYGIDSTVLGGLFSTGLNQVSFELPNYLKADHYHISLFDINYVFMGKAQSIERLMLKNMGGKGAFSYEIKFPYIINSEDVSLDLKNTIVGEYQSEKSQFNLKSKVRLEFENSQFEDEVIGDGKLFWEEGLSLKVSLKGELMQSKVKMLFKKDQIEIKGTHARLPKIFFNQFLKGLPVNEEEIYKGTFDLNWKEKDSFQEFDLEGKTSKLVWNNNPGMFNLLYRLNGTDFLQMDPQMNIIVDDAFWISLNFEQKIDLLLYLDKLSQKSQKSDIKILTTKKKVLLHKSQACLFSEDLNCKKVSFKFEVDDTSKKLIVKTKQLSLLTDAFFKVNLHKLNRVIDFTGVYDLVEENYGFNLIFSPLSTITNSGLSLKFPLDWQGWDLSKIASMVSLKCDQDFCQTLPFSVNHQNKKFEMTLSNSSQDDGGVVVDSDPNTPNIVLLIK
jgi:hypothetical protein